MVISNKTKIQERDHWRNADDKGMCAFMADHRDDLFGIDYGSVQDSTPRSVSGDKAAIWWTYSNGSSPFGRFLGALANAISYLADAEKKVTVRIMLGDSDTASSSVSSKAIRRYGG